MDGRIGLSRVFWGARMRVVSGVLALGAAAILFTAQPAPAGDEPVLLREVFPDGYTYRVSCSTDFSGALQVPSGDAKDPKTKPLKVSGASSIEYDERVLEASTT